MKESILRAAAIAALALALIMSVTTWVGVSTSSQRGSFFMGFFEFALILFLGAVAWALFNALADAVANRTTLEMITVRLARLESAVEQLGSPEPGGAQAATNAPTNAPAGATQPTPGADEERG